MSRRMLEDSSARGLEIHNRLRLVGNPTTLGAGLTLTDAFPTFQQYDCGGSTRILTLPVRALANDFLIFLISNISTAGENLTINAAPATTIMTIPPSAMGLIIASGTSEAPGTRGWAVAALGNDDLVVLDDLTVTDALTVGGAAALNGVVQLGNSTTDGIAFWGTTTITQRAGTNQATSLAITNSVGTAAGALILEMANTLIAVGLMKGGA